MHPETLTAADLVAHLDANPRATAADLLRRGRLLTAREIITLVRITRGGPISHNYFSRLVDRIARRWATSRRSTDPQPNRTVPTRGSEGRSVDRPGARASASALSSLRPAGEGSNLPAGPEEITTEWTLTIRRPR